MLDSFAMESDRNAKRIGYPSAHHWLTLVTGEAAFNVIAPDRLIEYDQIFRHPRRPVSRQESELLAACEHPADIDYLTTHGHLTATGALTREATEAYWRAVDALERASR